MTDQIDIQMLFRALVKNWSRIVIFAAIGGCFGIIIAFSIPKEYQSSVVLVPESGSQSGNASSMGGMASMMGINLSGKTSDGINEKMYPEIIHSSLFLNEFRNMLIRHQDTNVTCYEYVTNHLRETWWNYAIKLSAKIFTVFSSDKHNEDLEYIFYKPSLVDMRFEHELKDRILAEIDKKSGLLSISIKMQDAEAAFIIADSVAVKLQKYVQRYKTSKTRADLENKQQMLEQAKDAYYTADNAYAQAQDKNQNLISKMANTKLDRLKNEKELAYEVYQGLAIQVESNAIKLQEETPVITILEPSRIPVQPISPNKKLIFFSFAFLGAVIISAKIVLNTIFKSRKSY